MKVRELHHHAHSIQVESPFSQGDSQRDYRGYFTVMELPKCTLVHSGH